MRKVKSTRHSAPAIRRKGLFLPQLFLTYLCKSSFFNYKWRPGLSQTANFLKQIKAGSHPISASDSLLLLFLAA